MRILALKTASQGGVIINELHAANWQGQVDDFGDAEDWVELYNPSTEAISLDGYGLTNKVASPFLWVIPSGTWISPRSYKVIWLSKKDRAVAGAQLHANFNLDNGGDSIWLTAPNGTPAGLQIDTATPALVKPDQSWCRMPSGSAGSPFMVCSKPTFNYGNTGIAYPTILAKPTLSVTSGFYAAAVQVTISGPVGASIRYTTDGNAPTEASNLYTAPLAIGSSTVLRAAAFANGAEGSLTETGTYIIDAGMAAQYTTRKAVFVAMPPADLPRFQSGDKSLASYSAFEMVTGGRTTVFKLDAEGSAAGQEGSWDAPQRAMNVTARDAFGTKAVNAVLWPEKPTITSTKKFRLRNGSNDWARAHLRDQLSQSLGGGGPNLYGSSATVAMFINGVYYGLADIREREDETLAVNNLGLDKDYVDDLFDPLLGAQEIKNGGAAALSRYQSFHTQVTSNDMADQSKYDQVKPQFNPESLAWDWALHMLLVSNDWPNRNVHVWRSPEYDGRWNWHAHDFDVAFGLYHVDASTNMTVSFSAQGSEVVASLLRNVEFRNLFLNTTADQMNAITPTAMNARLDVMAAEMQPYIADYFAKNGLGTEATWVGHVNKLRDYFSSRIGFYDTHTRNYFSLQNRGAVNVAVNDTSMGSVKVNTLDTSKLMAAGDPSWTGLYYPGVPMTLEAKPKVGYTFVGWQGASASTTRKITHTIPTGSAVNADGFSARWTGQLLARTAGSYRLQTVSNDGVRVWLNGAQIINNWNAHSDATDTSATVTLEANTRYDITVEYYDATGNATMRLLWQPPGAAAFMAIPASSLYPSAAATLTSGLSGAYFNNQTLTGPAVAQAIEPVDFVWSSGAPTPSAAQYTAVFAAAGTPANPVMQTVPAQTSLTGDVVAVQVSATDPGGFELKYSASKLPKGINIHPVTGMVYGRITTPGVYDTKFTVTNGSKSSSVTIVWTVTDRVAPSGPVDVFACGGEGTSCGVAAGATADVYYGANGNYLVQHGVTGQITCNTATFGSDPAPETYKHCFYVVTGMGNVGPTVALTAPTANATYPAGNPVTVTANAADSDGSVAKVEFYDGAVLIGSATSAPYAVTWTPSTSGAHSLTAKATDNQGGVTVSAAVVVAVSVQGSVFCANEGGICALPNGAVADVYFGANGNFIIKQNVTGSIACTRAVFGSDPASGVAKSCSYVVSGQGGGSNTPPTVSVTAPVASSSYAAGAAITVTASASDNGSVASVEFFDGATSLGVVTSAPYSLTWTPSVAGTHNLTAKATDNLGLSTTSASVSVTITAQGSVFCANEGGTCVIPVGAVADVYFGAPGMQSVKLNITGSIACTRAAFGGDPAPERAKSCYYVVVGQGGNTPPTVSVTAPGAASSYAAGTAITVTASAADNGSVVSVEFFDGSTSLGVVTSAPYSLTWTPTTAGVHSITAKATDNLGLSTTSGAVSVTITQPGGGNTPPTVSVTAPVASSSYAAGAAITVTASASDNGSVASVEFFDGATSLGVVTSAPYSLTWTPSVAGTHNLTAKATDNLGLSTTSASVSVTITAQGSVFCANEGGTCVIPVGAVADVYFGAAGMQSVKLNITGSIACTRAAFGGDPAPERAKSCSYVVVSQGGGGNTPPTVSLTAPGANTSYSANTAITVTASASDDGSVASVEFFDGSTSLGVVTSAPYSLAWTPTTAGVHSITAKATDNQGASRTSAAVSVTITAQGSVSCAVEGATCVIPVGAVADVYFGTNGMLAVKMGISGSIACTRAAFGTDPAPERAKTCYYVRVN